MIITQLLNRKYGHCGMVWSMMMLLPFVWLESAFGQSRSELRLENSTLQLIWSRDKNGYYLQSLTLKDDAGQKEHLTMAAQQRTILYAKNKPLDKLATVYDNDGKLIHFPDSQYRYVIPVWSQSLSPVSLNTAGEVLHYQPTAVASTLRSGLRFRYENEKIALSEEWNLDPDHRYDICVRMTLKAKESGYYSLSSPSLAIGDRKQFQWAVIPGLFQGGALNPDFVRAYAYGHGIPDRPVIVRERTASTLASLLTTQSGVTLAAVAEPGTGRDPWLKGVKTHSDWKLGLSLMNRNNELTPTLYHPVLGEEGSYLRAGQEITFSFRYTIQKTSWYNVLGHIIKDIYQFSDFLKLKQTNRSFTDRLYAMYDYVISDSTSRWRTAHYKNTEIGAQDYLGGVYGSEKDAMKNSDYGAMWMLAKLTEDIKLQEQRLPEALNFKLQQQQRDPGFFYGSAAGQYYLYRSHRFTEEWGPYSEPIGTTYYMLMDIGNILLFEPDRSDIKLALRTAADWLLSKMHPDGHWEVAYDNKSGSPMFEDVSDLRPTFYGLLVAHQLLKDEKYREGAIKGANWFVRHAAKKGWFLGVCGDTRFAPDFATAQSIQALLDMYTLTKDQQYQTAAYQVARYYTTSVYTHPIPSREVKHVNGINRQDWEISQVGLGFEHGSIMGSANHHGPILLSSHAGLFVRLYAQTKDSLLLNMARAAVWGRDAFVDASTGVASYYWDAMNKGAGPFPHHAWWQLGWITDYLLSEAALRSNGNITFPGGFITPKVGPHRSYGFEKGSIFGKPVDLKMKKGLISLDNAHIDYILATNSDNKELYVVLLNNSVDQQQARLTLDADHSRDLFGLAQKEAYLLNSDGTDAIRMATSSDWKISLPATGLKIMKISY
ncbi:MULTISPECIES: glycerophosphoryl diester phosphodiesterase [unclassified Sphingobacterium]|uniref:glycerophosphoryl diester phosphodiesterase n=1 Tax=unclassified Sphingobacterium TaxID=2609468 RepID=UPI0025F0B018|nr:MULTISPECIES: glycerophosphoryl diester phosphodiesterase [unclassified Sphingobacterium]